MIGPLPITIKRVICCGSRLWRDRRAIKSRLLLLPKDVVVVHGAHWEGADAIIMHVCFELGLKQEPHPADWDKHGKAAGPIRNSAMAQAGGNLCIAWWHPDAHAGTDDMLKKARRAHILTETIRNGAKHG